MKFMIVVKATAETEAGVMPADPQLEEMGHYNQQLVNAGVMLAGEGLHPTSKGVRIRFEGSERIVYDGPFPETKELVAGFWIWKVSSMDEAVDWLKRAPFGGGDEVEIRPIFSEEDFGEAFTPELRELEQRLRERSATKSMS